jgi:hypothetical protein
MRIDERAFGFQRLVMLSDVGPKLAALALGETPLPPEYRYRHNKKMPIDLQKPSPNAIRSLIFYVVGLLV